MAGFERAAYRRALDELAATAAQHGATGAMKSPTYIGSPASATPENFQKMFLQSAMSTPERERVFDQIQKILKGQPERISMPDPAPFSGQGRGLFDFSGMGSYPDAYLRRFDLPVPNRGIPPEMMKALKKNVGRYVDDTAAGRERAGDAWYDMSPANRFFERQENPLTSARGPLALQRMSAFSAQKPPPQEILGGFGYHTAAEQNLDPYEEVRNLWGADPLPIHVKGATRFDERGGYGQRSGSGAIESNPKIFPYNEAKAGNLFAYPADTHEIQSWMPDLYVTPTAKQKGVLAMLTQEIARRSGLPGVAPMMSSHWMEAAPRNMLGMSPALKAAHGLPKGLSPEEELEYWRARYAPPYASLLENSLVDRANFLGVDPHEFASGAFAGKGFAGGGLASYVRSRLQQEAKRANTSQMRDKLSQWAQESISDPFRVSASGRKALALGDDKVLKLVGEYARGVREQQIEGEPYLAKQGLLPELHWRSPNDELTVTERIPYSGKQTMAPFWKNAQLLYRLGGYSDTDLHRAPELQKFMAKRGLSPFLDYDINGDFFVPEHWRFRDPSPRPTGTPPTLIDAGALQPGLASPQVESEYMPEMRNIASLRADYLEKALKNTQPQSYLQEIRNNVDWDPGRLIFSFPDMEQGYVDPLKAINPQDDLFKKMGLAHGGSVAHQLAKAASLLRNDQWMSDQDGNVYGYAGGGVARNFLRGVPGSHFDDILKGLKERYGNQALMANAHPNNPEEIARQQKAFAMQTWIDKNLGNYIVRHLGTEDDPLSAQLPTLNRMGDAPKLVRRMPAASVAERLTPSEMRNQRVMPENRPWEAKNQKGELYYPAWLNKLMEQDWPRHKQAVQKLWDASEQLDKAGGNRELVDKARAAYDEAQRANNVGDYAFKGLPDPIWLHDLNRSQWDQYMHEPIRGMMDFMTQHYTPEQISKVSVPDAMRGSLAWHEALAKKKQEMLEDPFVGTKVHKEYPNGFKWVKFDPDAAREELITDYKGKPSPHNDVLEAALQAEGNAMGHCVGGYCDDVLSGQSEIYSLRDPQGQPHVTVEVTPPRRSGDQVPLSQIGGMSDEELPSIQQIKGKGNAAPVKDYVPYVQDFVRSGKWGNVGDLQNTGMRQIYPWEGTASSGMYATPEELAQFARHAYPGRNEGSNTWLSRDDWLKQFLNDHPDSTQQFAQTQLPQRQNAFRYDIPADWQPGPIQIPGQAEGGPIKKPEPQPDGMSGVRGLEEAKWMLNFLGMNPEEIFEEGLAQNPG